jgi:preprotein translocase subunit SecB
LEAVFAEHSSGVWCRLSYPKDHSSPFCFAESGIEATREDAPHTEYVVETDVAIGDLGRSEDGLVAAVTLSAAISFSRTDGAEGPLPFSLEPDVHGVFRWPPDDLPPSDDLAEAWLEYNGMYLLWPYLRSYIATITGFSHLPALTIYTMNVPKPPVIPEADAVGLADDTGPETVTPAPVNEE